MERPVIAFCLGDLAGIGPEITLKALAQPDVRAGCRALAIGDAAHLAALKGIVETEVRWRETASIAEAQWEPGVVDVLCPDDARGVGAMWGHLDPACGAAAAACLRAAYEAAAAGLVHGVVSAPLNKEAFHRAGYGYADELQWLAHETDSPDAQMMGVMGRVWTLSLAEHVAFCDILGYVTRERILAGVRRMHRTLVDLGGETARVAVAALNVHGGEGGLLGREELDIIAPAVAEAAAEGIDVYGPIPADMVFVQALANRYDGVVAMHHDQANIARKLQPMSEGATVFCGLPVYCATTAHGTAFDIAGRGVADPGSLIAAVRVVTRLASAV